MDDLSFILLVIVVLLFLWQKYKGNKKTVNISLDENEEIENTGRFATDDESIFLDYAFENYAHMIFIVAGRDNVSYGKYNQLVLLSEDDDIYLHINIYFSGSEELFSANCYFSGKTDFFWKNEEVSFEGFDLQKINKALKDLKIRD